MLEIATCSFGEYRPEMGMPVRTSIGAPKWFAHPHACWQNVYPQRYWLHLPYDKYKPRYLAMLDERGPRLLKADLAAMAKQFRARNGGPVPKTAVLLCYEKLSKGPDNWCHRTMLAEWLTANLSVNVVELGAVPAAPIDPDPTLF